VLVPNGLFVLIEFGSRFVSVNRKEIRSVLVTAESKTVRTGQGRRNELESIGTGLGVA
jgi:hypothetical protein